MSENERKTRENGYYWVRDHIGQVGDLFIVQLADGCVLRMGYDNGELRDTFESGFEFVEGPLKPLPLDLKLMLEVIAQARAVIASIEESGEIWGADGLAEALRKLDYLGRP